MTSKNKALVVAFVIFAVFGYASYSFVTYEVGFDLPIFGHISLGHPLISLAQPTLFIGIALTVIVYYMMTRRKET